MAERNSISNVQLIFVLAVLLLLCAGLQSAFGCLLQERQAYNPEIRVDSCHRVVSQKKMAPCCKSEACHQTTPLQRDLGSPEYHTQHKVLHSLAHESRPLTPQLKVGQPFIIHHPALPQFFSLARASQTPLQSHHSLRTTVLLH
ncbi:MAG: hypothetical protein PF441_09450 [Desulfuromusa sp.]|nr:hypothetical protein [Desulfuromusa sp.]